LGKITDTRTNWLDNDQLEQVRGQVPLVYVDAVPARVNERIRDALSRHIEKDLGPMALPKIPPEPAPFTIVEYFTNPEISGFHDPRHHAVSLAFVVPVSGDCQPSQQALDLGWYTPEQAISAEMRREMTGGHDRLVRLALASVGVLP
jgi:hypothetical protein